MNKEEIKNKVKEIIVDQNGFEAKQVTDSADFKADLKMDSLDTVELIMAAEKEFGISIPLYEEGKVSCLNDCVELVEKYVNQK